jgi:hypothetical protein
MKWKGSIQLKEKVKKDDLSQISLLEGIIKKIKVLALRVNYDGRLRNTWIE